MNLPALQVTLEELLFHTQQIAQGRGIPLGEVSVKIDPKVRGLRGLGRSVGGWPATRSRNLNRR